MYSIKRLYVENYKLFQEKYIDFDKALLSVLDGPNGYGKTSVFDAIELLVTGSIGRVKECESIDGKRAYDTIFFARENNKDVILKAEFIDSKTKDCFTIGTIVKPDSIKRKNANPKNVYESLKFYKLNDFDTPIEEWDNYINSKEEIDKLRKDKFGHQNIEQFSLFHYIQQENRLSYFKNNEETRSKILEDILGVEEQREKHKKVKAKYKEIEKLCKSIGDEIKKTRESIIEDDRRYEGEVEYIQLIDGKNEWDKEKIMFPNNNAKELLKQYNKELDGIEQYIKFSGYHETAKAYKKLLNISDSSEFDLAKAWLLIVDNEIPIEKVENNSKWLAFLDKQEQLLRSQKYLNVDFIRIFEIIKLDYTELLRDIDDLKEISQNQREIQGIINGVLHIREEFHKESKKINHSGICPYCGYEWENSECLNEQFETTKHKLENMLEKDGTKYALQVDRIKERVENEVLPNIKSKIDELKESDIIKVYNMFGSKESFIAKMAYVNDLFVLAKRKLIDEEGRFDGEIDKNSELLIDMCYRLGKGIPNDYIVADQNYDFAEIEKRNELSYEKIKNISLESIDDKRRYINIQFYKSLDKLKEKLIQLENKKETLDSISAQLMGYANSLDKAIVAYKKQIITEIEIPFFVYSSRLLQSYQGGQGVMMEYEGDNIRFKAPHNEHDVLYTMSSGQLSAVTLAFSLALNKTYAGEEFKTIMIDDPIQCMDDINIISFIELLRREFSDYQIVLSTHEDNFSNLIRYKFKKYGQETQAIRLKDA